MQQVRCWQGNVVGDLVWGVWAKQEVSLREGEDHSSSHTAAVTHILLKTIFKTGSSSFLSLDLCHQTALALAPLHVEDGIGLLVSIKENLVGGKNFAVKADTKDFPVPERLRSIYFCSQELAESKSIFIGN